MKIPELKKLIEHYNPDEKSKIIVELYKRIPKKVKEEYDIDGYLSNANLQKSKKEEIKMDSRAIIDQVDSFIQAARAECYRSRRHSNTSTWRSIIRNLYKNLTSIPPNDENFPESLETLRDFYDLLVYGSCYYIFPTCNTFSAAGQTQYSIFYKYVEGLLYINPSIDNITEVFPELLEDAYYIDRIIRFDDIYNLFSKYVSFDEMIEALNKAIINEKNKYSSNRSYVTKMRIENLVYCGLYFYYKNNNLTEGIKYFQHNFPNKENRDDNLKELLDLIQKYNEEYKISNC